MIDMEKIKLLSVKGFVKPDVKYKITKAGKRILKSDPNIFFDLNVELKNEFSNPPRIGEVWIIDNINMFCWYIDDMSVKFRNVESSSDIVHFNFDEHTCVTCIYKPIGEGL